MSRENLINRREEVREKGLEPIQMLQRLPHFLLKVEELCDLVGFNASNLVCDHVALRINDDETVDEVRKQWEVVADQISCAEVNGRPILVYKFTEPCPKFKNWRIECLELPYPAPGKKYPEEDWEHVEFVVESAASSLNDYVSDVLEKHPTLKKNWPTLESQGIEVKMSSPFATSQSLNNYSIAFKKDGVCFKIHPYTLATVVASEKK